MYRLIRKLLFSLDAEDAHEWTTEQMRHLQEIPLALRLISSLCRPNATHSFLGLTFRSRIGIAAGFDKNARLMPFLAALGFGFVEVGTVTLRPQPGNPRPRLFRRPDALINRMGFNNDGAEVIAARLERWRTGTPACPLFVNVGKNRDVPLEAAVENYVECYRRVAPHADAAVLNLSSPNTPGLRDLQKPEHLDSLLRAVRDVRSGPILIKIAPDLDDAQIAEITDVCVTLADGMICTNTTITEGGGLSGKPLREKSTSVLAKVRARAGAEYPLIGVGGVFTKDDVREKIDAGANLVQLYTSFVYEGPMIAKRLAS
ncbi:MAG TPA: quinone-dependent dihydroorotate dehydrogenase [Thermoanaerobaculia bacterium]|nr:quinone-dependent dihydroorotate dehydrogenase [Thermoanaerobaculia bacterium]